MKNNKYRLIPEDCKINYGRKLYRIKALKDFGVVKAGELGGYIESENNLSFDGEAWVCENAEVFDNARICNDARIYGNARICEDARVSNKATVGGNALIYGNALICENARVYGNVMIRGNALVCGNATIYGNAVLSDNVIIEKDTDWFTVGPIGNRNGFTTFSLNKDKSIYVFCGCFHGNIDEFEKAVEETHKGTKYEEEYKLAIALAKKKITTVETNKMTELTNEYIDSLIDKAKKNMYIEPSLKAMMITATFPCGWVISSTANVVSGQEFVEEELRDKCLDDIKSKVWELERYRKTVDNYKKTLK